MANGYARELLKIVIAQICQSMDCEGIEQSACETMVDILQHYIEELGYLSHMYAEHAGRIECNFNDSQLALKDLQVSMRELMLFHSQVEETPFARAIPRFPMGPSQKRRKVLTSADALPNHIPLYFPPFPDKHSFVHTALFVEREKDRKKLRARKKQRKNSIRRQLNEISWKSRHNQYN
jgi:transcription initiation factor TFIID subunit 8